uniref:Reverse transcriptase zinc-binding domain-containing protein n=1 Tax=Setaria viridis TaxID=4556 RepID=A0A4U6TTN2_SETVI|nr:hypothetical protein SEVIR_7G137400v2 [Setaria viridis]
MALESYHCELCIRQKRETTYHLFFRCNFAQAYWRSIGITYMHTRPILNIIEQLKGKLGTSFFMEIIILMTWSIWTTRNNWMFNNIDPLSLSCKQNFVSKLKDLSLRIKSRHRPRLEDWIQSL